MIYIPNLLTLARIALVPWLIVLLQEQQFLMSLIVFVVAGITDGLDGYIAKHYNAQTQLGAILDPLADKALLVSSFVMLSMMQLIPFWLVVAVVFRDIVIVCGYLIFILFFGAVETQPLKISKLNTFLQIVFIIIVLGMLAGASELSILIPPLSYAVLITSIASGCAYVYIGAVKATQTPQVQTTDVQADDGLDSVDQGSLSENVIDRRAKIK
ncbi:MAG: cardiolipin synthase [Arenicella sp.]|jgi:cardiolipin synthase